MPGPFCNIFDGLLLYSSNKEVTYLIIPMLQTKRLSYREREGLKYLLTQQCQQPRRAHRLGLGPTGTVAIPGDISQWVCWHPRLKGLPGLPWTLWVVYVCICKWHEYPIWEKSLYRFHKNYYKLCINCWRMNYVSIVGE